MNNADNTPEAPRVDPDRRMVVGLDDSPGSAKALHWAAQHVDQLGKVQPVSTWHYPWWAVSAPAPGSPLPPPDEVFTGEVTSTVERMLSDIPAQNRLETIIHRGSAGPTLVEIASGSDVIVVGTRGRGAVADTLLGSVSLHCVTHADVPVIIVPTHTSVADVSGRVVVGIDGSANSVAALAWALDNTPASTEVEAVHAWSFPVDVLPEMTLEHTESEGAEATAKLERAIEAAVDRSSGGRTGDDVVRRTEYGDPRSVLREAATDADMLVLGARGEGGFTHLLLGSMTTALCHQPITTIAVIPRPADHTADE